MIEAVIFYFFAANLVAAATGVIVARNSVYAVLFLVLAFFSSAALWLLLEAEFLAIILVLVYVGALMVLFLFVVMMVDTDVVPLRSAVARYLPLGALIATLIALQMAVVLGSRRFGREIFPPPERVAAGHSNTKQLGELLYTVYAYPFEIAGAILLLGIVAAISLTLRQGPRSRGRPAGWTTVRREDRVRLVSMASGNEADKKGGAAENEVSS